MFDIVRINICLLYKLHNIYLKRDTTCKDILKIRQRDKIQQFFYYLQGGYNDKNLQTAAYIRLILKNTFSLRQIPEFRIVFLNTLSINTLNTNTRIKATKHNIPRMTLFATSV
ncbi:hypothetical protein PvtlMGM1_2380 [Prevotella sp. MGM1]|nr:hypothetical protein PvtlMGM1_2380 [Prevotella sp. MGM1]